MEILFTLVILFCVAWINWILAEKKGRNPHVWFIVGLFFGFLSLLILWLLPSLKQTKGESDLVPVPEPVLEIKPTSDTASHAQWASDRWYYVSLEGVQMGPIDFSLVQEMMKDNRVRPETYLWCEGMENWKRCRDLSFGQKLLVK